ncbi:murein peptide amidase A [Phytoactinopolyspora halotolerans]|uniref:Murein peptide amidase A n=2 Tax=Phytoactinopolyspora halotolerans TaxID=1981512 RepID=A0A6L9SFM6_9ACTN|nr:murein peptide amidase A [Phytoactinopolyspora halotolerans]
MTMTPARAGQEALQRIPEFATIPSVDELNRDFTEIAERAGAPLRRIGTSRLGEPLWALTVGDGPAQAVVFGGVHPNEPIGALTATHLARTLVDDDDLRERLGYTWHIVPCIDPDGARLNEAWFAGPYTRGHYARHFYRPAPDEQVEWTFPFSYKRAYFDRMMPETVALMRLIDDTKPAFMCSLHNGEHGGIYYYVSRETPGLYEHLHAIPEELGLPLDTGEPEVPYVPRLADAIFRAAGSEEAYDFTEAAGLDPADRDAGTSSWAYAEKYGTLSLVTEVPYWSHPDANDGEPTEETYAEVLKVRAEGLDELATMLGDTLRAAEPDLSVQSPFLRASRAFIPAFVKVAQQEHYRSEQAEAARQATKAERFGCLDLVHMFRLRYGGMLLRAFDGELAIGNGTPTIREQHAALSAVYDSWVAEAEAGTSSEPIPLGKLAAVQYAAILATCVYAIAPQS